MLQPHLRHSVYGNKFSLVHLLAARREEEQPCRPIRRLTLRHIEQFKYKRFLDYDLSDLCLGYEGPFSPIVIRDNVAISVHDTVADALAALKTLKMIEDHYVSVWNCNHSFIQKQQQSQIQFQKQCSCTCIGKICMVDIICFLSKPQNLSSPSAALHSPISAILQDNFAVLVLHFSPSASLREVIEVMHEGVQNLVIPIKNKDKYLNRNNMHHNNNTIYSWLTQRMMLRFLFNIRGFYPTTSNPINTLGIIETQNFFAVCYDDPASSILDLLALSLISPQSSVAIVDTNGKFVGEISPIMLNSCDESIVSAIATLSVGDLIAYIHCGGQLEDSVQLVKEKVEKKAIYCYPWDRLGIVMINALSDLMTHMWIVEKDRTLVGIVTFQGILKYYKDHLSQWQPIRRR